jgi:23S rRNA pseudouridine1911/1915/1917 synthase
MKKKDLDFRRGPKTAEKTTKLKVSEPAELMAFLMAKLPDHSRSSVKALLTRGQVVVDNYPVTQYNHPLQPGQDVVIDWSGPRKDETVKDLEILFEDHDLIVIIKPSGLLAIASENEKEKTAYHILAGHVRKTDPGKRLFIVHRLDRDTSGVMLFAKSEEVKNKLQNQWKRIVTERAYVAVVEGTVRKPEGTIASRLAETKTKLMYSTTKPGEGVEAVTHYKVLQSSAARSLLELHLETGRKNQIRVHMKDIGHSIVGDKKYGALTNPIGRLALHARILAFRHPVTGQPLRFEAPIPPEFLRLVR